MDHMLPGEAEYGRAEAGREKEEAECGLISFEVPMSSKPHGRPGEGGRMMAPTGIRPNPRKPCDLIWKVSLCRDSIKEFEIILDLLGRSPPPKCCHNHPYRRGAAGELVNTEGEIGAEGERCGPEPVDAGSPPEVGGRKEWIPFQSLPRHQITLILAQGVPILDFWSPQL